MGVLGRLGGRKGKGKMKLHFNLKKLKSTF